MTEQEIDELIARMTIVPLTEWACPEATGHDESRSIVLRLSR